MRALVALAVVLGACHDGKPASEASLTAQGTVRALHSVQVRASIPGQIKEISADFGTPVKSGQPLATLDAKAYEARVSQARADVQAAQLAKAPALVRQREALLKQAEADVERTVIRAPVDGTVILRNAGVGQDVAAGPAAAVLFSVAQDLRSIQIEAAIDEAHARGLRPGMAASFSVEAFPRRRFSGEVLEVRAGKPYTVVIAASNPDLALLPGMTANVRMPPAP